LRRKKTEGHNKEGDHFKKVNIKRIKRHLLRQTSRS